MDVELLNHRRVPIDDVNLAQRNLRIGSCHLLQAWGELSTRPAPVRIKIDNGHIAECEMFCDVYLCTVSDYFGLLAATSDDRSRCRQLSLLTCSWCVSRPITVFFFGQSPSQFRLLVLKGCLTGSLFGRVRGALRGIVLKTFLNLFRQLGEINFRDSRFTDEDNAVGFDSAYLNVFVFFPVNRFEVVTEGDCRKPED